MVKRYTLIGTAGQVSIMVTGNGDHVSFADHNKRVLGLEMQLQQERTIGESLNRMLRAAMEVNKRLIECNKELEQQIGQVLGDNLIKTEEINELEHIVRKVDAEAKELREDLLHEELDADRYKTDLDSLINALLRRGFDAAEIKEMIRG